MKVILREDVPELGAIGDVVDVKDGYGRNYLLPMKLALPADMKSIRQLDHQKRLVDSYKSKVKKDASALADKLSGVSCTIPMLVGEQDKLFGSVTTKDIESALAQEGVHISRKRIVLEEPIKQLGVFTVEVRLHPEISAKLKVWVVAK